MESGDDISSWLEAAYNGKDPVDDPLLYTNIVERLYSQVISLSDKLHDISSNLRQFKYVISSILNESAYDNVATEMMKHLLYLKPLSMEQIFLQLT